MVCRYVDATFVFYENLGEHWRIQRVAKWAKVSQWLGKKLFTASLSKQAQ